MEVNLRSAAAASQAKPEPAPGKVREAARQFEALLLAQLLQSARQGSEGWLGAGEDGAGGIAAGYAEQQLAEAMAAQGGLGIASLVVQGLERKPG